MDWAGAIEINKAALARIIAGLLTVVGLVEGGIVARLPKPLYYAVLLMLRPTEAAVRRLIVIAARGLKVTLPPSRPMPKGLVLAAKGTGRVSFQLFDPRKRFDWVPHAPQAEPGSHGLDACPPSPVVQPQPAVRSRPEPEDGSVDATRLSRRILALKLALETLPKQAQRLARWKAKRKQMENPKFTSPLRPGHPPGHRRKATDEIDFVLKECHGLAWDALREDSS